MAAREAHRWLGVGLGVLIAATSAPAAAGQGPPLTESVLVYVFTAVDCPISDRYAPELSRLATSFGDRVRFTLVYANHGDTAAGIEAHAGAFGFAMPHIRDDGTLVRKANVTVTPEAAVFDRSGRLVYRGRIDDRYTDYGVDRPTPTRRDLAVALEEMLAGRPVTVPETRSIGCAIVRRP